MAGGRSDQLILQTRHHAVLRPPRICTAMQIRDPQTRKVQRYPAHKKTPSPKTLQQASAQGSMQVLGGGNFLMSEVPLYHTLGFARPCKSAILERAKHPVRGLHCRVVLSVMLISYISWHQITGAIRLITIRADIISARALGFFKKKEISGGKLRFHRKKSPVECTGFAESILTPPYRGLRGHFVSNPHVDYRWMIHRSQP